MTMPFFKRFKFYVSTWTGCLLLANTILFILITVWDGSLVSPDSKTLIQWGAKDPVSIAQGEWWRFLSPIFLHFGVLHFALNNLALKVVGSYLEPLVGAVWFLIVYFVGGVSGNILSSLTNVSLGAGASGAIFALIGLGLTIERLVLYREGQGLWKMGPFTYMTFLNIALALAFNLISSLAAGGRIGIDNSAHLGGLFAGMLLGLVMLLIKKNRLIASRIPLASLLIVCLSSILTWGAYECLETPHIFKTFISQAERSEELPQSYYYYTQALKIDRSDADVRFRRGSTLLRMDEIHYAMPDLLYSAQFPTFEGAFSALYTELLQENRSEAAAAVKRIMEKQKLRKTL